MGQNYKINTLAFLPEKRRNDELFAYVADLLDWLIRGVVEYIDLADPDYVRVEGSWIQVRDYWKNGTALLLRMERRGYAEETEAGIIVPPPPLSTDAAYYAVNLYDWAEWFRSRYGTYPDNAEENSWIGEKYRLRFAVSSEDADPEQLDPSNPVYPQCVTFEGSGRGILIIVPKGSAGGAYYAEPMRKAESLYDVQHDYFDPDRLLDHLGAAQFAPLLRDLSEEQKKTFCLACASLYHLKGTKKGLMYLLSLLGHRTEIYQWFDINQWHIEGDLEWPEAVPPCSIVLKVELGDKALTDEFEASFIGFLDSLLWICTRIYEIRWVKRFSDQIDFSQWSDEVVEPSLSHSVISAYSNEIFVCDGPFHADPAWEPLCYADPDAAPEDAPAYDDGTSAYVPPNGYVQLMHPGLYEAIYYGRSAELVFRPPRPEDEASYPALDTGTDIECLRYADPDAEDDVAPCFGQYWWSCWASEGTEYYSGCRVDTLSLADQLFESAAEDYPFGRWRTMRYVDASSEEEEVNRLFEPPSASDDDPEVWHYGEVHDELVVRVFEDDFDYIDTLGTMEFGENAFGGKVPVLD